MIRKGLLLFLFACLVIGCGDTAPLQVLYDVQLILSEPSEVTDLTPEVWETIRMVREANVAHWEWTIQNCPECFLIDDYEAEYEKMLAEAAAEKERQEAFYNRYIDADGIAIIGNTCTPDAFFVAAKKIVLIMTSKHPELRKQLRGLWYFDIRWDGFPKDEDCITPPLFPTNPASFVSGWCANALYTDDDGYMVGIGRCFATIGPHSPFMQTFVHEFAHALEARIYRLDNTFGRPTTNPKVKGELHKAYETATANGTWEGAYASYSIHEYWAEMVERWFYIDDGDPETYTTEFETYEDFKEKDPLAYALLDKWFPKVSFSVRGDDILGLKEFETW